MRLGADTDYLNSTVDDGLDDEFLEEFTDMPMIPDSLTDSSDFEVTLQLKALVRGLNDLYTGMPQLNEADETTDVHSIRHGIALGTDLYLCESLSTSLAHWTSEQIAEFHRCAEIILADYCPKGKFVKWIILPRFRLCFDTQKYAAALVRAQLDDQEMWGLIVGDVNRIGEMSDIADLAVAVYHEMQRQAGGGGTSADAEPPLLQAPFTPALIDLFRSVAKLAAGHHPNLFAHLLAGFAMHVNDACADTAALLRQCYTTPAAYETLHGDMALMVECLVAVSHSPVTAKNVAAFVQDATREYKPPFAFELCAYLHLGVPAVTSSTPSLSPDATTSSYKLNALRQGSPPLHVRLAFEKLPRQLAAAAVTIFRYTYERSLKALGQYASSWRMNDFKTFDHPREALVKIINHILACPAVAKALNHQTSADNTTADPRVDLPLDSDGDLISALYETCLDGSLDFGFAEANDIDETERNIDARWERAHDGDNTHAESDLVYELSDGEDEDPAADLPDLVALSAKFAPPEPHDFEDKEPLSAAAAEADKGALDPAIFDACVRRLERAGGRIEDVNVDELVDELFFKS
ncbi:hypothetical protein RI367_001162 [Sorochytrium milnesiophthora]